MRTFLLMIFAVAAIGCSSGPATATNGGNDSNTARSATPAPPADTLPVYTYQVVNKFPHDPHAFTQGLVFQNGFLYESTGQYDESTIRKVDPQTGRIVQRYDVPGDYFAEGMTIFNDKVYQLTWRQGKAFVYDLVELRPQKEFTYTGEGWGLTHDDKHLIMSDGTQVLKFLDPNTFKTMLTLLVTYEGKPLKSINELEYIKGEIWANVWHSEEKDVLQRPNRIARIDPVTGKVTSWVDLDGISPEDEKRDSENTLNGIAYDAANDRIFVTGKNWSNLYEIKVSLRSQPGN